MFEFKISQNSNPNWNLGNDEDVLCAFYQPVFCRVSASERCLEDVLNRIVFTREAVEKTQAKRDQLLTDSETRMQEIKVTSGTFYPNADVLLV